MSLAEAATASVVVALVLGVSYLVIIGVALFHPDRDRRRSAARILQSHRLTRRQIGRSK